MFEVEPAPDQERRYLALAAEMRPLLEQVDGFVSVERFRSLTRPNALLSLSFFEDEEAVRRWRTLSAHRNVQGDGRRDVFTDYRLRVAHVLRDYGLNERAQAPTDSRRAHDLRGIDAADDSTAAGRS